MASRGLYRDELSSETHSCELVLQGRSLYIYLQDQSKELIIWNLGSVDARLVGNTLHLNRKSNLQLTLECSGSIAREVYDVWMQPAPLEKKQRKTSGQVYAFFIIVAASILAAFVLVYLFVVPWLAQKATALVPVSAEIELGTQLSSVYEQEAHANDSLNYYLKKFVTQLDVDSPYPLSVKAIPSSEINAFAVPGGHIFVYTGMLQKLDSYEELAALLGHEMTHVTERHSLKSMVRGAATSMVIASLFGDVSSLAPWLLSKADEFKQLDYSRELEMEADTKGLDLMVQKKIDPRGMLRLLNLLKTEAAEMPAMMKYLSTHPETQARIDKVAANPYSKLQFDPNANLQKLFDGIKRNL